MTKRKKSARSNTACSTSIEEIKSSKKNIKVTYKKTNTSSHVASAGVDDKNLGQRLIKGIREINSGGGKRYTVELPTGVRLVRSKMGLTQAEFAARLNISLRTLQEWEQGARKPSGAAVALLDIAYHYPNIFKSRDPNNQQPSVWL